MWARANTGMKVWGDNSKMNVKTIIPLNGKALSCASAATALGEAGVGPLTGRHHSVPRLWVTPFLRTAAAGNLVAAV